VLSGKTRIFLIPAIAAPIRQIACPIVAKSRREQTDHTVTPKGQYRITIHGRLRFSVIYPMIAQRVAPFAARGGFK
jgi:hypothetical protein